MKFIAIIIIGLFLNITAQAQSNSNDSAFLKKEQFNIINNNLNSYYDAPALQRNNNPVSHTNFEIDYRQERSDKYIWQKGSGFNDFNIHINSFSTKKNNLVVWGAFDYKNNKTYAVNFNNNLDYDYLYPYVMADTVGGNLKNENYSITGGLSKTYNKTTLGLQSSFLGQQSIRNRDPRIQNISSNFNLTLSLSQQLSKKYLAAVALIGERYFQKSKVTFNSELGRPTIFHEAGLGNYNRLFANTRDNSDYTGYNYGASLHLVPQEHMGWFFTVKYIGTNFDKKIKDLDFVLNNAKKNQFDVQLGHKIAVSTSSNLEIGVTTKLHTLKGLETKFYNFQSQLVPLTKESLYSSNKENYGGYVSFQQAKPSTTWAITFNTTVANEKETYVLPASNQQIKSLNLMTELALNQKINKSSLITRLKIGQYNPLSAHANWAIYPTESFRYQMLKNNFDYKNTKTSTIDFSVKLAKQVKTLNTVFVGANVGYSSAYNLKQFGITSGFVF